MILNNTRGPSLSYAELIKVGHINVQGLMSPAKVHRLADIMKDRAHMMLFVSETRSTAYYSFNSQGFAFHLNGSRQHKFAGVGVVISPVIMPFKTSIK